MVEEKVEKAQAGLDLLRSFLSQMSNPLPRDLEVALLDVDRAISSSNDAVAHCKNVQQLKAADTMSSSLLESAPDAIVTVDRTGTMTLVNSQTEQLFGYPRRELLGQSIDLLLPDRFRANHGEHRARYNASPRPRPMGIGLELFGRKRDGSEFPVEISVSPLEYVGESSDGLIVMAIIRDMTARDVIRRQLQESEERFRRLVEDVKDYAIYMLDAEGRVVTWNAGAKRLKGYAPEEIIGEHFSRFYPPEDVAEGKPNRSLEIAVSDGRQEDEGWRVRKDGTRFWANAVITPLRDQNDNLLGFTKVTRDITERKEAEESLARHAQELARSNTELEQFAYVASHDLQEPLRMVASYTQLLSRRYIGKLDADADEFISYAVDGATRMQELIQDLLAYSRVGTRGKDFAETDCSEVYERAVGNLDQALADSGAQVTADPLPTVVADNSQLVQVFQNLIANAIKFHGDRPARVHVSATLVAGEWLFSIRDNGIGIEPAYRDRLKIDPYM